MWVGAVAPADRCGAHALQPHSGACLSGWQGSGGGLCIHRGGSSRGAWLGDVWAAGPRQQRQRQQRRLQRLQRRLPCQRSRRMAASACSSPAAPLPALPPHMQATRCVVLHAAEMQVTEARLGGPEGDAGAWLGWLAAGAWEGFRLQASGEVWSWPSLHAPPPTHPPHPLAAQQAPCSGARTRSSWSCALGGRCRAAAAPPCCGCASPTRCGRA